MYSMLFVYLPALQWSNIPECKPNLFCPKWKRHLNGAYAQVRACRRLPGALKTKHMPLDYGHGFAALSFAVFISSAFAVVLFDTFTHVCVCVCSHYIVKIGTHNAPKLVQETSARLLRQSKFFWDGKYSISQEICRRFCCALFCCAYPIVYNGFTWSIYPYSSGLHCLHWGNR